MSENTPFRAGFVALVGRPNVGKSTLLNAILGQKLAITTSRPQTTRTRILGVRTYPNGQLVLVDTPGLHKPTGRGKSRLNHFMVEEAKTALSEVDLVAVVVEPERQRSAPGRDAKKIPPLIVDAGNRFVMDEVVATKKPAVLVLNKVDHVRDKRDLLPLVAKLAADYPSFLDIVPISARKGDNVARLAEVLVSRLPEGKALYPEDMLTDRAERWLAAEFVREQVFLATHEEVPYSIAVSIDTYEERPPTDSKKAGDVMIEATIHVEKPSQKAIVVGSGGSRIKDIGTKARAEISQLVGCPVHLKLFVRVDEDWTEDRSMLVELGYGE